MPFDPDAYLASKPAFDPDAYLKSKPKTPAQSMGETGEALLGGAQQGMLAGYAPQFSGLIASSLGSGTEDIDKELEAKGFKVQKPNLYLKARDEETARQSALQTQSPYAYGAGQLGGAVATIPAYGALAKGALGVGKAVPGLGAGARLVEAGMAAKPGLIGRSAQAAVGGATQAAVMNPGDVEGQITGLQVPERIENAKQAGLLSAAVPVAGAVLGKAGQAIGALPKRLETMAETRAVAALGAKQKHINKLIEKDPTGFEGLNLKEMGKWVQENGIVKPGDEILDIVNKAATAKTTIGEAIGSAYDAANKALEDPKVLKGLSKEIKNKLNSTIFDKNKLAKEFESTLEDLKGRGRGIEIAKAASSELDSFIANPKKILSIKDLQQFKADLDDFIFPKDGKPVQMLPESKAALFRFRDFLKKKIDVRIDAIDSAFGKEIGVDLKDLNKQYGIATQAHKIAKDRMATELGNNWLSLSNNLAVGGGIAGAAGGLAQGQDIETASRGALLGFGAGLLGKAGRTYGRPLLMTGAKKAGEALGSLPPGLPSLMQGGAGLVQKSPGASGAAAVRGLMNQKNERK